ncbi:MAG: helix-turn-helix domain-containing protein [Cyclobacteriaceae bacterium]
MNLPSDKSIAVLPFSNMSADGENEFFCDGITEEIIDALAKIEGLKVISRTSSFYYKNSKTPLQEISEKLQVANLLEGSVRIANDKLRIKAQLINVEEDEVFWTETWDRKKENLFDIQDEISLLIADKLREHYGHMEISDHLVNSGTNNLTAYEHLLKGRHHFYKWNPEDTNIAIEHFERAIALDSELTEGYLGIADSYSFLAVAGLAPREEAWQKSIAAIGSAKKLDPDHAGLNYMLAFQSFFTEADFASAMQYGMKSLAAKPTYSEAHQLVSFLHTLLGDFKKAWEHILFAKSSDPLNPETRFHEANYYYRAGEYASAKEILNELLAANDKNLPAIIVNIYILIQEGQLEEARQAIDIIPQQAFAPDERLGLLCLVDVSGGKADSPFLAELEQHALEPTAHHAHLYLFIVYTRLGEYDKAFHVLENLFTAQSSILLLGFSDPMANPIRNDSRYSEYHSRVYPMVEEKPKSPKSKSKGIDQNNARLQAEKLRAFVSSERPFLNPALTLRALAEQLEIHPNQLSWLLNEFVGKNFNEFINHERIAHFKKLVVDPDNSHISLIGLAYESGFNSKTVFNTAFKKAEGMTPKEYQKSQV